MRKDYLNGCQMTMSMIGDKRYEVDRRTDESERCELTLSRESTRLRNDSGSPTYPPLTHRWGSYKLANHAPSPFVLKFPLHFLIDQNIPSRINFFI